VKVSDVRSRLARPLGPYVEGDYHLNPDWADKLDPSRPLRPAAVLVPLVDRADGATVLLTQRTDTLSNHAGQISFPGGRIDAEDATPEAAALREAEEEIGLARSFVEVIGALPVYETRTSYAVTPVIGAISPGFALTANPAEVADIFEVPLGFLLDPANVQRQSRFWQGRDRHFYAIPYGERYIWGATAGMLVNLAHALGVRP
jgi:8-oxo-dGTP pyrophosphatase MutT (NUDIX family)